jgi:Protein of unknown function (DUF3179)
MILKAIAAVVLAVAAAAAVAAPVLLQNPYEAQSPAGLWIAHALRQWGVPITIALAVAVIGVALWIAPRARWWGKALLVAPVAIALAAAWFARENPFEWWFNPLAQPRFVPASEASFVEPADLVLAVAADGESAAYPIRLMAYHHIVNDRIGRTPAVVTY